MSWKELQKDSLIQKNDDMAMATVPENEERRLPSLPAEFMYHSPFTNAPQESLTPCLHYTTSSQYQPVMHIIL